MVSLNSILCSFPFSSVYIIKPSDGPAPSSLSFSGDFITICSISIPSSLLLLFDELKSKNIVNGFSSLGFSPSFIPNLTTELLFNNMSFNLLPLSSALVSSLISLISIILSVFSTFASS